MKNICAHASSPSLLCTMGLLCTVLVMPLPHAYAEPSCSWRFSASGGTITDHNTNLVWQQQLATTGPQLCDVDQSNGCYSLEEAQLYCDNLALAGGGWRLPSIAELSSIVEDDGSIDPQFVGNFGVWSSTRYTRTQGFSWYLDGKRMGYRLDTSGYFVRCVR